MSSPERDAHTLEEIASAKQPSPLQSAHADIDVEVLEETAQRTLLSEVAVPALQEAVPDGCASPASAATPSAAAAAVAPAALDSMLLTAAAGTATTTSSNAAPMRPPRAYGHSLMARALADERVRMQAAAAAAATPPFDDDSAMPYAGRLRERDGQVHTPPLQMQLNSLPMDNFAAQSDALSSVDAHAAAGAPRVVAAWSDETAPISASAPSSSSPAAAAASVPEVEPLFARRRLPSPSSRPPIPPRPTRSLLGSTPVASVPAVSTPRLPAPKASALLASGGFKLSASIMGFELVYADGRSSATLPAAGLSALSADSQAKFNPQFVLFKILVTLRPCSQPVSAQQSPTRTPADAPPAPDDSSGSALELEPPAVGSSSQHARSLSANTDSAQASTSGTNSRASRHAHSQSTFHAPHAAANAAPVRGWFIYRRYSDFDKLHKRLLNLPHLGGASNIENHWLLFMPPKVRAPASFTSGVIEMRYSLFDSYVRNLCARPELWELPDVQALLGVDEAASLPLRGKSSGTSVRRGKQVLSAQLLAKVTDPRNISRDAESAADASANLFECGLVIAPSSAAPLYSIPASSVLDFCSTGDIILFRTESTLSAVQRSLTSSQWDHVAMIVSRPILSKSKSNLCVLESVNRGGIRCNPLEGALQEWRRRGMQKLEKIRLKQAAGGGADGADYEQTDEDGHAHPSSVGGSSLHAGLVGPSILLPGVSLLASSLASSPAPDPMLAPESYFPVISVRKLYNWNPSEASLLRLEEFVDGIVGNAYSLRGIFKLGRKMISNMVTQAAGMQANTLAQEKAGAAQTSYFCSELIAACYRIVGLMPDPQQAARGDTGGCDASNPLLRKSASNFLPGDFSTEDANVRVALDQLLWTSAGVKMGDEVRIDLHVDEHESSGERELQSNIATGTRRSSLPSETAMRAATAERMQQRSRAPSHASANELPDGLPAMTRARSTQQLRAQTLRTHQPDGGHLVDALRAPAEQSAHARFSPHSSAVASGASLISSEADADELSSIAVPRASSLRSPPSSSNSSRAHTPTGSSSAVSAALSPSVPIGEAAAFDACIMPPSAPASSANAKASHAKMRSISKIQQLMGTAGTSEPLLETLSAYDDESIPVRARSSTLHSGRSTLAPPYDMQTARQSPPLQSPPSPLLKKHASKGSRDKIKALMGEALSPSAAHTTGRAHAAASLPQSQLTSDSSIASTSAPSSSSQPAGPVVDSSAASAIPPAAAAAVGTPSVAITPSRARTKGSGDKLRGLLGGGAAAVWATEGAGYARTHALTPTAGQSEHSQTAANDGAAAATQAHPLVSPTARAPAVLLAPAGDLLMDPASVPGRSASSSADLQQGRVVLDVERIHIVDDFIA